MKTKGYDVGGYCHFILTLGGREETAGAHSSISLRGLSVGDGSMWVLTKGGILGVGGEPVPWPGPGTGYLDQLSLSTGGTPPQLRQQIHPWARDSGGRTGTWRLPMDSVRSSRFMMRECRHQWRGQPT